MIPRLPFDVLLACVCGAGAVVPLAAGPDLSRIAPVPADQPIPVHDFFRPRLWEQPEPNGPVSHVAALFPATADNLGLVVADLNHLEAMPLVIAQSGERTIHAFDWITADRLSFRSLAFEGTALPSVFVADVSRGLRHYPVLENMDGLLVGVPDARPGRPLLMVGLHVSGVRGRGGQVIEINTDVELPVTQYSAQSALEFGRIRERNERRIVRAFPDLGDVVKVRYLADKMGELAFVITREDGVYALHAFVDGAWVRCPVDLDAIEVVASGDQAGELIVRGPRNPDKPRALHFMNATTGALGDLILQDADYDIHGGVVRDPRTRQVIGVRFDRMSPTVVWFSEQYRSVQNYLEANFPGKLVHAWPVDQTGDKVFFEVQSDRQPPAYYRADLAKRTLSLLKSSAPWLDPERMCAAASFKFKTAEGARLDAYVTLPVGATKETPAPLVVLPHRSRGGHLTLGFDAEAQFFASRGFAVLRPNTRGSRATEWKFTDADRWDFLKMRDDVTVATRALLKTGLIDAERVAIVGSEFGAYLAMCGLAQEPDLYRCAVVVSGTFDWAWSIEERKTTRSLGPDLAELVRWMGLPRDQPERYAALSPLTAISRVKGAVLVAYDERSSAESNAARPLIDTLKRHGIAHEEVTETGAFVRSGRFAERVELYTRIEAFLRRHLAGADEGRDVSAR